MTVTTTRIGDRATFIDAVAQAAALGVPPADLVEQVGVTAEAVHRRLIRAGQFDLAEYVAPEMVAARARRRAESKTSAWAESAAERADAGVSALSACADEAAAERAVFVEDVEWMIVTGASPAEVVSRVGGTAKSVQRRLERAGRYDLAPFLTCEVKWEKTRQAVAS